MLDRDRPPTHRSEEPEHETVIWDRLRAEAESSRGSSVYPAAKHGEPSESVYLEYDDEELLEAMHAEEDDKPGSAPKAPTPPPPHRPTTLGLGAPSFIETEGHEEPVDAPIEEPVDEDLSEDMSMLAHLTLPPHAFAKPGEDERDDGREDGREDVIDVSATSVDPAPEARRSEPPPFLLQTRPSQVPMLPSRGSQPPELPTRSSQPGIMDRTFQSPNERERGSQPPGFSFQAAVPPSYPTPGSSDRSSRPPSQPPLPPSFGTAETVEDAFPKKPAEPNVFERSQELFEKAQSQAAQSPGARWEQAWAEWDRQFDIPSLPVSVEQGTSSRSRLLVPGIVGLVALVGLSAAGFQLMGSSAPAAEAPRAQEHAGPSAAEQAAKDEAAVRAADEALAAMAAAEAAAKKRSAERLAAATTATTDGDNGGQPQQVVATTTESAPMSKAEQRERYREERRAARREARHRKRELKRQQEREAARAAPSADAKGTKDDKGDDPLYGVGDEDEE